ncbi:MAG: hypothetical protein ACOCXJ_08430, partial [Planctomycetota bacterium]
MTTAFTHVAEHHHPGWNCTAHLYRHASGALHIHCETADEHRSCTIALRTPPVDDRGLPHVLEHCVLCGSQAFPVRDPFFHMLRRSLQTFMNAMTAGESTLYPFATCNARDFEHLLDVYLDAIYRPLLRDTDLLQEGCRLRPPPDGPAWAGIVHNEMRGAFEDPDEHMYRALLRSLLPDGCYAHCSGGLPLATTTLRPEDLRAFHAAHYGLANTCVVSYGALDPVRVQTALLAVAPPGRRIAPPDLQAARGDRGQQRVALPGLQPGSGSQTWLGWVWGDSLD